MTRPKTLISPLTICQQKTGTPQIVFRPFIRYLSFVWLIFRLGVIPTLPCQKLESKSGPIINFHVILFTTISSKIHYSPSRKSTIV